MDGNAESLNVFVQMLNGECHKLGTFESQTLQTSVGQLKQTIADITGIPIHQQKLMLEAGLVGNNTTLAECADESQNSITFSLYRFRLSIMSACCRPTAPGKELIFFLTDGRWLLWDFTPDLILDGPRPLSEGWFAPLPEPFDGGFDAVVEDPNQMHHSPHNGTHLLLFKHAHVLRWDFTPDQPLGARPICDEFPGLPEPFTTKVDAVVRRPTADQQLIFFNDCKWVCYDTRASAVVEGGVHTLQSKWFAALPEPFASGIDAVVRRPTAMGSQLIFFREEKWLLWDFTPDRVRDGPFSLLGGWFSNLGLSMGLAPPVQSLDVNRPLVAACCRPTAPGKELIFFFTDRRWLLWDFSPDSILDGPKPLSIGWFASLPDPFDGGFDSVVEDPNRMHHSPHNGTHLLFFRDAQVLRWDFTPDRSLGARPICDEFPGLPEPFTAKVDAVVRRPTADQQLIFFNGHKWVCYDTRASAVVEGGVHTLQSKWFAPLPEPFASGIDAVVRRPTAMGSQLIFFREEKWLLWDFTPDRVLEGPYGLTDGWFKTMGEALGLRPTCDVEAVTSTSDVPEGHASTEDNNNEEAAT